MPETPLTPPAAFQAWVALLEADHGPGALAKLGRQTSEGLLVPPLGLGPLPEPGAPGETAARGWRATPGWRSLQLVEAPDLASAMAQLDEDLGGGVTGFWLRGPEVVGQRPGRGLPAAALTDWSVLLTRLDRRRVVTWVEAGRQTRALLEVWPPGEGVALLDDPWARVALRGEPVDAGLAADLLSAAQAGPGLVVDTSIFRHAGLGSAAALGVGLAGLWGLLREVDARGLDPVVAWPKIAVRLRLDGQLLEGAASLRAWRALLQILGAELGAGPGGPVHAVPDETALTRREPKLNLLRVSQACLAGALGGADFLTSLPYDHRVGASTSLSRRLARNVHHLLAKEAWLEEVVDPLGGSFALEAMTDALAERAWEVFQQIEAGGGLAVALREGTLAATCAEQAARRARRVATSAERLLGVNEQAHPDERVLGEAEEQEGGFPFRARAAAWERLGARVAAASAAGKVVPVVYLAALGPLAEHEARTSWTAQQLAAAGLRAVRAGGDGTEASLVQGFRASGAGAVVLTSADVRHLEGGLSLAKALREAGGQVVWVAGRPGELREAWLQAGVGGFLHLGQDGPDVLGQLLDALGVKP